MIPRIIIASQAERELREAIDWYERQQPGLGVRFEAQVNRALCRIAQNPNRFPRVSRLAWKARVLRWPHSIFFTVSSDRHHVIVLAVFHGKRNPKLLQQRLG
jgi:plasmid stabilization system protein ParE